MDQEGDEGRENCGARCERREGESCGRGKLAPFSDSPSVAIGGRDARGHGPEGHHDEGDVEEQSQEALLGGDGDGLGVGDGDGDVLVRAVVAVGVLEGAGAVALERAFGEEVEAAGDEVGAAAGVDVEAVERLSLPEPPTRVTTRTAPTTPTATAASVHFQLQRIAASTARPASRAMKLDCEKVWARPSQRTATRTVSRAKARRSFTHSSAAIATTITSAR